MNTTTNKAKCSSLFVIYKNTVIIIHNYLAYPGHTSDGGCLLLVCVEHHGCGVVVSVVTLGLTQHRHGGSQVSTYRSLLTQPHGDTDMEIVRLEA